MQRVQIFSGRGHMRQTMEEIGVRTGRHLPLEADGHQPDRQEKYDHSGQQYRQQHIRDEGPQLHL